MVQNSLINILGELSSVNVSQNAKLEERLPDVVCGVTLQRNTQNVCIVIYVTLHICFILSSFLVGRSSSCSVC